MLNFLRDYTRHFSWPILLAMIALMTIGVLAIHLAEEVDSSLSGYAAKQFVFACAGMVAFFVASVVHYQLVGRSSYVLAIITLALLAAVFLFAPSNGSQRWIPLAGGVKFQPSELAKLMMIITLAWYLRYRDSYRRLLGLIVPFAITLVPLTMILMEPDLGTSLLLPPTLMVMLFMAGARLRHLLIVVALGLGVVLLPVAARVDDEPFGRQYAQGRFNAAALGPITFYSVNDSLPWSKRPEIPVSYCRLRMGAGAVYDLQPLSLWAMIQANRAYQVKRIEGWLRQNDPRIRDHMGYQQYHSMMILGSGQLTGRKAWKAADSYFRMLPYDHTDFIFSVIGGQWGFVGCVIVLGLYGVIFLFGADVAASTRDPFGRLLAVGVLALLAAQIFINIGMTMGLMPITGMTLPMISYGGSSLLVNCAAMGLLVNVGRHRPQSLAPSPFEFAES